MNAILFNGSFPLIPFTLKVIKAFSCAGKEIVVVCDTRFSHFILKLLLSKNNKKIIHFVIFENYVLQKKESNCIIYDGIKEWISDIERDVLFGFDFLNKGNCKALGKKFNLFIEEIIDLWRIDRFIYEPASNFYSLVIYKKCIEHNIEYVGMHQSRIKGLVDIVGISGSMCSPTLKSIELYGLKISKYKAFEKFKNDLGNLRPYQIKEKKNFKKLIIQIIFPFLKNYFYFISSDKNSYYQYPKALKFFTSNACRKIFKKKKSKSQDTVVNDIPYYVYFCHFHPESSTSVLSPEYINDGYLISQLITKLPKDINLLIKKHPDCPYNFDENINRLIEKFNNIYYVSIRSYELINHKNCKAVITVAGTAGLEAICCGKPVICFNNVFYANPKCSRSLDIESIEDHFNELKNFKPATLEQRANSFEYFEKYSIESKSNINSWNEISFDEAILKIIL